MTYYVKFTGFGPDNKTPKTEENPNPCDKSILWTLLYERDNPTKVLASGWVSNERMGLNEIDKEEEFPVTMNDTYYKEHRNGGRTNTRQYASPEDYWNDPVVTDLVQRKYREGIEFSFTHHGDPDRMDKIYIFRVKTQVCELSEALYDFEDKRYAPPQEWYNQVHERKIEELGTKEVFSSAEETFEALRTSEDLFGDRYFPVAKAPKEHAELLVDECHAFKGCSQPLFDDKFVYVGIRSKPSEIGSIEDIFAIPGGTILKQTEWDW